MAGDGNSGVEFGGAMRVCGSQTRPRGKRYVRSRGGPVQEGGGGGRDMCSV